MLREKHSELARNRDGRRRPVRLGRSTLPTPIAARSILVFGVNPNDEQGARGPKRILAHAKCNVGRLQRSRELTLTRAPDRPVWRVPDRHLARGDRRHVRRGRRRPGEGLLRAKDGAAGRGQAVPARTTGGRAAPRQRGVRPRRGRRHLTQHAQAGQEGVADRLVSARGGLVVVLPAEDDPPQEELFIKEEGQ